MHSDPGLVARLFEVLPVDLEPKKVFGGQCWMLNGNMCVGVYKEFLITRIGVDAYERIKDDNGVHPMDITGRPMKGWAKVDQTVIKCDEDLKKHCDMAIYFVAQLPMK